MKVVTILKSNLWNASSIILQVSPNVRKIWLKSDKVKLGMCVYHHRRWCSLNAMFFMFEIWSRQAPVVFAVKKGNLIMQHTQIWIAKSVQTVQTIISTNYGLLRTEQVTYSLVLSNNVRSTNVKSIMKVNISSLKCIQINTQHSFYASANLSQVILDLDIDLVFVQEPYTTTSQRVISIPNYQMDTRFIMH